MMAVSAPLGLAAAAIGGLTSVACDKAFGRGGRKPSKNEMIGDIDDFAVGAALNMIGSSTSGAEPTTLKTTIFGKHAQELYLKMAIDKMIQTAVGVAVDAVTSSPSTSQAATSAMNSTGSSVSKFEVKMSALARQLSQSNINNETRSSIEKQIQKEVKKKKAKDRERARRDREEEEGRQKAFYESAMISLSKYSVLVYDLNKLPSFNSGNRSRQGVYGKR